MEELTVMVDLAGQVRILLARGLEHDLYQVSASRQRICSHHSVDAYLGAIGEFMRREVHLSK